MVRRFPHRGILGNIVGFRSRDFDDSNMKISIQPVRNQISICDSISIPFELTAVTLRLLIFSDSIQNKYGVIENVSTIRALRSISHYKAPSKRLEKYRDVTG